MNFNALIHRADRAHYARILRGTAKRRWLAFQLRKLIAVYWPAMRAAPDRKSWPRMIGDCLRLAASTRCLPVHYFHYGLYRKAVSRAAMAGYLPETRFYYHCLPHLNQFHVLLDDKIVAEEIARANRVPIPRTVAVRRDGRWLDAARRDVRSPGELAALFAQAGDVVVKPSWLSSGGEGVRVLARDARGWRDQQGPVDLERLHAEPGPDLIVQRRCRNGGSLARFGADALECFRVLTWCEGGRAEVLYITLKVTAAGAAVDNGHAGGAYVAIDKHSGRLGGVAIDEWGREYPAHPVAGIPFGDVVVGEVAEIVAVAEHAARAFARIAVIGWDIATSDEGIVVIEGNSSPGLALMQRPHGGLPLLVARLRARGLR